LDVETKNENEYKKEEKLASTFKEAENQAEVFEAA